MAPDEYSAGGGGKLKLKGSKVNDGRVEKKKKKKGLKKKEGAESEKAESENPESQAIAKKDDAEVKEDEEQGDSGIGSAKTEAEKKYEEIRRKRLHERLQREGVKTHKERVEDLNKYLSRLSEHHDMPKIGPG